MPTAETTREPQILYLVDRHEIAENELPTINELCGISPAEGARKAPVLNALSAGFVLSMYGDPVKARNKTLTGTTDTGQPYRIGPPHAMLEGLLKTVSARFKRKFPGGVLRGSTWKRRSTFRDKKDEALYLYELFFTSRTCLKQLTDASRSYESRKMSEFFIEIPATQIDYLCTPKVEPLGSELFLDDFRNAIKGHDIRRFKCCPICGTFFVAWRIDKGACSPKCLAVNRVRRHRGRQSVYELRSKLKAAAGHPKTGKKSRED